MKNMVNNEI
ncbi:hypothetical protein YPPY14_1662, partial [Yersinia pestis PY-14]